MNEAGLRKKYTFDQYGRYAVIRNIINANRRTDEKFRILDVGGGADNLSDFLEGDDVYWLDPRPDTAGPNFIKGDGSSIPAKDASFDWVTSADVFEHVLPEKRELFLGENLRVAKKGIVLAAPFFSEKVIEAEKNASENYKMLFGEENEWLNEHLKNVLPKESLMEGFAKKHGCELQKISHNNLFLWQLYIASVTIFPKWVSIYGPDIGGELKKLNLFYNTEIFPNDFCEPAYRKIYFIKKEAGLADWKYEQEPIGESMFLETIKAWTDFINNVYKIIIRAESENDRRKYAEDNQGRENELSRMENEIAAMKKSKFWKLREKYLKLKKVTSLS